MFELEDLGRIFSGQSDLCRIFDNFRLVDPQNGLSYRLDQGKLVLLACHGDPTEGLARQSQLQRRQLAKVELRDQKAKLLIAVPITCLCQPMVLELEKEIAGPGGDFQAVCSNCGNIPDILLELGNLASTDSFTGLYNKNTLELRLRRNLQEARDTGRSLCAAMVDIDNFKQINDLYGHTFGDEVILQIVPLLRRHTDGGENWSARFGGDEFLTIFPGEDLPCVQRRCDALKQDIDLFPFRRGDQPVSVSVSIGTATFDPQTDTLSQFLDRVDRAMYQKKKQKKAVQL